ncbi:hypothetical protein C0995_002668 [Termitomyces sp. Mi166|nr:hypothetical protein C0995_002668 [Termitomyces sp. Mi166\
MLHHPIPETSHQSKLLLSEHISRLSVALAPHKRMPNEILEHIFCSQSEYDGIVELPPVLSSYPWVLGRVCSRWRRLSRSLRQLWNTTICSGSVRSGYHDPQKARKQLDCALDVLPECARLYLCIGVMRDRDVLPTSALTVYLSRLVTKLKYSDDIEHPEQESLDILPPGTLSKLEILSVSLAQPKTDIEISTSYAGLFGSSSRLQHLKLRSDTPNFLLADIPWHQLRSFRLEVVWCDMNAHTRASWTQIAHSADLFRRMTSLEILVLDMVDDYCSILLTCEFPWHQLRSLIIYWKASNKEQNFPLILKPLAKCTALTYLKLSNFGNPFDPVKHDPIALPSLQYLDAEYVDLSGSAVPPSILMSIVSSGALRVLLMGRVTLGEFYTLVAQCPRLEKIKSNITQGENEETVTNAIVLPHLLWLGLALTPKSLFPTRIVTPQLIFLHIEVEFAKFADRSDLLESVIVYITRSDMQLRELYLVGRTIFDDSLTQVMRDFISTLNSCTAVVLVGVIFPQEIRDEIATGVHLPHVKHFAISVSDASEFFEMVINRLKREEASGVVCLELVEGFVRSNTLLSARYFEPMVGKIGERFGVTCRVAPLF